MSTGSYDPALDRQPLEHRAPGLAVHADAVQQNQGSPVPLLDVMPNHGTLSRSLF
jgi:hypothetical protein